MSISIGEFCDEATQYLLEFHPNDGDLTGLEIQSIILKIDGVAAPEFVQPTEERGIYRVNITGINKSMVIEIKARRRGTLQPGKIILQKKPLPD